MNISDLDYWQILSSREKMLGGVGFAFADQKPIINSSGEVVGTVSSFAFANAEGPKATGMATGFVNTGIMPDGSIFTSSGSTSTSSAGDRP